MIYFNSSKNFYKNLKYIRYNVLFRLRLLCLSAYEYILRSNFKLWGTTFNGFQIILQDGDKVRSLVRTRYKHILISSNVRWHYSKVISFVGAGRGSNFKLNTTNCHSYW